MAKLKSEIEVQCPCCDAVLVIDTNLRRVVSHRVPERGDKPERESLFEQSVEAEKTRDDALARRFEEALKKARHEPVTRPVRDFDLD